MHPILKCIIFIAILASAIWIISDSAEASDCTWKQTSSNLASVAGNWENGSVPVNGDNVYFTSLSTVACTWDITPTVNYFYIGSGYSGIITQSSNNINIGARGYYQAAGTLTGVGGSTYWVVDAGNFTKIGGTITNAVLRLEMTGTNKIIAASFQYLEVKISGSITNTGVLYGITANAKLTVTGTLTLGAGIETYKPNQDILSGTLISSGSNSLTVQAATVFTGWNGNLQQLRVILQYDGSANANDVMSQSLSLKYLWIKHPGVGYTVTLNLAGYTLTCPDILVGLRGSIIGSGQVFCNGNFDSYNGTTSGSWSLTMTGMSPYIKTAAGNTINGLTWTATNLRLASSLNVTKTFYVGGTSAVGSYYIAVKNGCNVTVTNGNTWTLMGQTRYWNRVIIAGTLTCTVPVSIWCNSTVYFNGTVNNNIVLHCNGWVHSMGGYVGNIWIETAYRNYIYYNGTFVRLNWNLTTSWILVEGFTPNPGDAYSKAGTMSIVTSIGHWMNISSLAGSPFIIDLVTWSILEGSYSWHITNLGATTVFTFSLYLAVDEVDMSVYRNNVFMEVLSVEEGGYLSFYDTIAPNVETSYLLVPGAANASAIDWYLIGFCLAILALLSYMGLKNENFMIIAGLGWIAVSVLEFQPIQNTVALIALGVGIIFAVWGAYKYAYG